MKYKTNKTNQTSKRSKKNTNEPSRKEIRKAQRKQVKERNRKFHQNKTQKHNDQNNNNRLHSANKNVSQSQNKSFDQKVKNLKSKVQQKPLIQKGSIKQENIQQQGFNQNVKIKTPHFQQDQQIRMLEEKLGIHKRKNTYSKFAKSMGLDHDLFDFLNNITKKVQGNMEDPTKMKDKRISQKAICDQLRPSKPHKFERQDNQQQPKKLKLKQKKIQKIKEKDLQQNEQKISIQDEDLTKKPNLTKKEEKKRQQNENKQMPIANNSVLRLSENAQQMQIKKSITSLFNKLSDGNLHISFDQCMQIFNSYPKAITIPIFSQLFVKYHIVIQKPILHVFLTGIALAVGLYQIMGDRLMAPLVKKLVDKYLELQIQRKDELQNGLNLQEIEQIGYSRVFERSKNFVNIICYLYQFGSITADFLFTYVKYLTQKIQEHLSKIKQNQKQRITQENDEVQFLYIIVQKTGSKMRSNDPSVLKSLIQQLKSIIKALKQEFVQETTKSSKIRFIEMQLQEIRFNKKTDNITILDQKMSFLHTFLNKNLPKQYGIQGKQKQSLSLNFLQIKDAKTGITDWWSNIGFSNQKSKGLQQQNSNAYLDQLSNQQKKKLQQLAKTLRFVTQIRQKIFFIVMQAQDYIEATQKIMESKIKTQQEIAAVILKVCLQEKTFNPYYPLICSKLASLNPKFRLNIQYAVWDQLKQIENFSLRQISNLGKFVAHIISQEMANSSISVLKFFPDITQLSQNQEVFMKILMRQFFRRFVSYSTKAYLSKLVNKLFEQNNYQIRVGFNQYLVDFIRTQKKEINTQSGQQIIESDYLQMAKLCRKLMLLENNKRQQSNQKEDI